MDILCRNIRTGEEKMLPPKVQKANESKWKPIYRAPEAKQPETIPVVVVDNQNGIEVSTPATKENLQSVYESLSGKKPDGRWNEKKLIEKIEELKETTINERN